jgi:hypothetical protein
VSERPSASDFRVAQEKKGQYLEGGGSKLLRSVSVLVYTNPYGVVRGDSNPYVGHIRVQHIWMCFTQLCVSYSSTGVFMPVSRVCVSVSVLEYECRTHKRSI